MAKSKGRTRKQLSPWMAAILSRLEAATMATESLPVLKATDEESALLEMEAMQPVPFLAIWNNLNAGAASLSISGAAIDGFLRGQGVDEGHRKYPEMRLACQDLLGTLAATVMTLGPMLDGEEPGPVSYSARY